MTLSSVCQRHTHSREKAISVACAFSQLLSYEFVLQSWIDRVGWGLVAAGFVVDWHTCARRLHSHTTQKHESIIVTNHMHWLSTKE